MNNNRLLVAKKVQHLFDFTAQRRQFAVRRRIKRLVVAEHLAGLVNGEDEFNRNAGSRRSAAGDEQSKIFFIGFNLAMMKYMSKSIMQSIIGPICISICSISSSTMRFLAMVFPLNPGIQ